MLDKRGRECWRTVCPYVTQESRLPDLAARMVWIGDLDGDGHNEVLFAPHPVEARESTPLVCYSHNGVERWRFINRRRVRTRAEEFSPQFSVSRFLVTPLGRGSSKGILVTSTHYTYYPCQAVLLTAEGKVLREYWHSGHLNFIESADLDGDGLREYYLAGISNAHHAATLVVLDEGHFGGASGEKEAEDYQLLGLERESERARIILPRSCLNVAADPYNTVVTFSAGSEEIVVQTGELIGYGAGIFHHFSPDLKRHRAVISDSYEIEYQKALQERRIQGCAADTRALQVLTPEGLTN